MPRSSKFDRGCTLRAVVFWFGIVNDAKRNNGGTFPLPDLMVNRQIVALTQLL